MLVVGLGRTNPYTDFLEARVLGIQQGTSVWVGSPKSWWWASVNE